MKKNYIEPRSLVADVDFDEIMQTGSEGDISLSSKEADLNLECESKSRFINFSDEDFDF